MDRGALASTSTASQPRGFTTLAPNVIEDALDEEPLMITCNSKRPKKDLRTDRKDRKGLDKHESGLDGNDDDADGIDSGLIPKRIVPKSGLLAFNGGKQLHDGTDNMTPDAWLDIASKHTTKRLMEKYAVTRLTINKRIRQAAYLVAQRENRFVGDVIFGMQRKQLTHRVLRDKGDFINAANQRARMRLAHRKKGKLEPRLTLDEYPCVFRSGGCDDHEFCRERYLQNLGQATRQARGKDKMRPAVATVPRQQRVGQTAPAGDVVPASTSSTDSRMSIARILRAPDSATAPTRALSSTANEYEADFETQTNISIKELDRKYHGLLDEILPKSGQSSRAHEFPTQANNSAWSGKINRGSESDRGRLESYIAKYGVVVIPD